MAGPGRPSNLTAIYALSDSDGVIRYVGKANDPSKRFAQHKAKVILAARRWCAEDPAFARWASGLGVLK